MRFTLTVDMDNAAFEGSSSRELRRIMRELAASSSLVNVGRGLDAGRVRDVNGNTVGEWIITDDDTPNDPPSCAACGQSPGY